MNLNNASHFVREGHAFGAALFAALALSACGGSGGDGPSNTPPGPNPGAGNSSGGGSASAHRISRIRYDLDNNGDIDSVRTFSYDADGRVVAEHYTYTGDGIADTDFGSFSIDAPPGDQTVTYTYDSAGLLQLWSNVDASGGRIDSRYEYGDDTLVDRYTIDMFAAHGALTNSTYFELDYTGTQLTGWRHYIDGGGTLMQSAALTHNAGGQVQSDLLTVAMTGAQTRTDYTYTPVGKVDLVRQSDPAAGSAFFNEHDYTYDSANTLVAEIITSSNPGDGYRWDYTVNGDGQRTQWRIDLGSDLTVEAVVHIEWEAGSCRQTFFWAPRAHPNFVATTTIPYVPGSGYAVLPVCGS
ncbi:MAG: hypothetical protein ACOY4D_03095 [Pseudomonadota bacterium]